jgi:hypothetical protein
VNLYAAIHYLLFIAIVTILVKPLGGYMERAFPGDAQSLIVYVFLLSGSSTG